VAERIGLVPRIWPSVEAPVRTRRPHGRLPEGRFGVAGLRVGRTWLIESPTCA